MHKDEKRTDEGRNAAREGQGVNKEKHNPFREKDVSKNAEEQVQDDAAIAEQQRKEALTERD
ncbi:MAG TPA: hypothetical protein VJ499_15775 [Flavisolibacter sp.]|nr:hypothetical protein [Flavisolibacter sp.]